MSALLARVVRFDGRPLYAHTGHRGSPRTRITRYGPEKWCGYCGQWLPLPECFNRLAARPDGYDNRCRDCYERHRADCTKRRRARMRERGRA